VTDGFNKWNDLAKSWSSQGIVGVPSRNREDLIKSKFRPEDAKRNVRAFIDDPLALNYAMGYKDRRYSMAFDIAKQVVQNLSLVAGIIQTRTNQVGSFAVPYRLSKSIGYVIKHKNPSRLTTKGEREMIQSLEKFIYNCGSSEFNKFDPHRQRDDFEAFLKKIVRDSLMYDQFAAEVVPDASGKPFEFLAVDASTIRLVSKASDLKNWLGHGTTPGSAPLAARIEPSGVQYPYRTMGVEAFDNIKDPAYMQLIHGHPTNVYSADELMFGIRNPRTDVHIQGYGYSEVEQLVSIITSHLYAEEYNRAFFRQGSAPKGLLVFRGDEMSSDQLEGFRRQWRSNLEGVSNSWRTPIMQSEAGVDWVNLNQTNKDMEYGQWMEYLIKVTCFPAEALVTMANGCSQEIANVLPGEHVITLEGDTKKVSNIQTSKYSGDIISIKAGDSEPLRMTDNHPVFVTTAQEALDGVAPYEVPARDVLDKHFLVVPKPQIEEVEAPTIDFGLYARSLASFFETAEETGIITGREKCKRFQTVDAEMAYFFGNFSITGVSKKTGKYIRLRVAGLNDTQLRTLEEYVPRQFGSPISMPSDDRVYRMGKYPLVYREICQPYLATYLSSKFGPSISKRVIPDFIMHGSKDIRVNFLRGVLDTVGEVLPSNDGAVVRLASTSKQLVSQLRHMFLGLGIYADVNHGVALKRSRYKYSTLTFSGMFVERLAATIPCTFSDKVEIERRLADSESLGTTYETLDSFLVPVTEISSEPVEDLAVYNLEVEDSHTYCVNNTAVHNCAVFLIDPAELNFDLHGGVSQTPLFESSQEWKLKASRDRGLKPMLRFISKHINNNIISKIDDNFVFDFVGLDELTEQEKHTLRQEQVQSYMTLNEIRRAEDLPDLDAGDVPMNPTYLQAIQTNMQVEQQAQQDAANNGQGGKAVDQDKGVDQGGEDEHLPDYSDNFVKSISDDYSEWERLSGVGDEE